MEIHLPIRRDSANTHVAPGEAVRLSLEGFGESPRYITITIEETGQGDTRTLSVDLDELRAALEALRSLA
jgi:hypothetical protein